MQSNRRTFDIDIIELPDGHTAVLLQPTIPDDADPALKNGLALRRQANLTGECPSCRTRLTWPNRKQRRAAHKAGKPIHAAMVHEPDCPALCDGEVAS